MMMGQSNGGGVPDPSKMQEMMQNPSMSKLLDNPEMLDTTINMLSSPAARPQVEQMAKQMNMNPDTLITVLKWLVRAAKAMK